MFLKQLWLQHFRNYDTCELEFPHTGVVVFRGLNGQGKSNILEAIAFLSTFRSFRGAAIDVVVQDGEESSILRGLASRSQRELLIEMQLFAGSMRNRIQVNKQSLKRSSDVLQYLAITTFSPDDLSLVKGGPSFRREAIDDVIASISAAYAQDCAELERVLRQRNTLLRQSGGRLRSDIATTLDVWDQKLSDVGERIGASRVRVLGELTPYVCEAYSDLSSASTTESIELEMTTTWKAHELRDALLSKRDADLARGVTTLGPHRDDVTLTLNGLPARTQASQGEQRTLALAFRLATHRYRTQSIGDTPVLLLDDVFSELDEYRSQKLLSFLPEGQAFVTTTDDIPNAVSPTVEYVVDNGRVFH